MTVNSKRIIKFYPTNNMLGRNDIAEAKTIGDVVDIVRERIDKEYQRYNGILPYIGRVRFIDQDGRHYTVYLDANIVEIDP